MNNPSFPSFLKIGFLALFALCIGGFAHATNTQETVLSGSSDLTQAGTYSPAGVPSATVDVIFSGTSSYTPSTFSDSSNTALAMGSLNDLYGNGTITIQNAVVGNTNAQIQLTGGDTVSGNTADALYVSGSSSLVIGGGAGVLGLFLEGSTNRFDVNGTFTTAANTTISIVNTKGLTFSGTGSSVINGNITGTGTPSTFAFADTGSVTLNGVSSAPVGATLTSGSLVLGNQNALQTNVLTQTGGTLVFASTAGTAFTLGGLGSTVAAGNITLQNSAAAAIALSIGNSIPANATYSANLSGGGSIIKIGSNQQTLGGTDTYTGTTTVNSGILEFTKQVSYYNNGAGQTAANTIVQPGGTLAFEVGNTGGFTAANIATYNAFGTATTGFENGSSLGIDTTGASLTYATPITNTNGGANMIGLNKLGTNSLILTGTSTYTGPTTVTAGTLQIGNSATNGSLASPSIANAGTLTFAPAAGTTESYSGSVGGSGGVTVNGNATGNTTLSGVNIYTGATTVTTGTLNVANSLALQNSNLTPAAASTVTFDSGVTSNAFTIGALSNNQNLVLNNTAGAGITLTIGNVTTNAGTAYSGVLSGLGGITQAGYRNTLALTGANTYSGTTTVTGGTLNLGNGGATGSIGVSGSAGPLVLGGFDNGGTLAYTRTGTVAQTFNGTTINAGGNVITESTATQTINLGAITSNPGGTVDIGSTGTVTTTSGNTNGILGGYATYGGKTTFAVAPSTPGGAITGLSAYTTTATAGTTPANYLNQNIDVSTVAPTGAITPNSLRFNQATAQTLTLTGVNTVTSGGILVTPTATGGGTITGGFLTGSAGGQLAVSSADQNFTINSTIEDNGAATAVTLSSNSSNGRYFTLGSANNSFSGGVFINGGGMTVPGGNTTALGVGTVTFGNQVFTGVAGGGIVFGTNAKVLTSGLLASADSNNTSNGEISGNSGGTWELVGSGTATFAGIIGSYSGGRVVNLQLDSGTEIIGNTQAGSSNVIVNGGTFQLGTGYWGAFSNGAQSVALTVGGGTYVQFGNYAGTSSQTYNLGLTVNSGASTVTVNANGNAGTLLNFAAAGSRAVGGTVNFNLPTNLGGTQTASNGITTSQLNTNGILGGYATVSGTDWATNATNTAGGNVIGLSTSSINSYTPSIATTIAPGSTANVDFQASNTTSFASQSINSLRFNTAAANTLTNTGTLIVASGGVLVTPNVNSNLTTITGGTVEGSASGDLVVIQNNTSAGLTISSQIANNTAATGLTKSGAGLLTLSPSVANTFTGAITLNGGTLNTTANGIGSAGSFIFNGGTLQAANAITTAKAITINANGGTVDTNGNAVTFSGNLTGGIAVGAGLIGSFDPTGEASFTKTGAGTLTLSGAANAFTGAFIINNGTVLDGATAAGTLGSGYLTFGNNANTPTVDLNGHSATVAGLIGAGSNGLITSGVAGTSTLTLNGAYSETFGGVVQNGNGTVALTENLNNATETVTLTGSNTYTGATLVTAGTLQVAKAGTAGAANGGTLGATAVTVNAAGTLLLGANNAIGTSSSLTLNGGTFKNAGAFSEGSGASLAGGSPSGGANNTGIGALTLSAASTLDFGSGTGTLVFNSLSDSGGFTLNVVNYVNNNFNDGTTTSGIDGTDDRLIFASDPSSFLSDINFGAGNTAAEINLGGGFYEVGISAVPEPTTIFAGLLALGLVGYRERRRLAAFVSNLVAA